MWPILFIALGAVALLVVVALAWRRASSTSSRPCPTWLGWLVELDNPIFRNNSARHILGHLALKPGMKVLDAGCGPGRVAIPAARSVGPGGEVTALDVQAGMLARVRAKAEAEGLHNVRLLHAGVGEGKLERGRYERALLVTVLGEIPDQAGALAEVFASLKAGGLLSVTEVIADPHFQRRAAVIQLARSAGFVEKASFGNRISYTLHFEKP